MRVRAAFLLGFSVWFGALTAVAVEPGLPTLPLRDVKPGMKGYGLTVFRGTQPERFDVEVIDVLHDFRPDQPLILVRTTHPVLERATTVAGMSGSPIYIQGKLVGAYAYGWSFGKDPVAGVTPIQNMRVEMARPVRRDSFPGAMPLGEKPIVASRNDARFLGGLPAWDGRGRRTAFDHLDRMAARFPAGVGGAHGPVRVSTPVMLSGMTDEVTAFVSKKLEPLGLVALQGAGGQGKPQAKARFVDGGAIGVQLIRGDVSMTGVGTVTEVAGGRLSAFGHPMMNAGEVGFPTATARVLHVLASENRSFKIAEAETPLGTLVHDRQSAIVIDTGIRPATIPVTVKLTGVEGAPRTEWRMEVASHRLLTPMLVFSGIANAISATASDVTDVVFVAKSRVDIEGIGPVEVVDRGFAGSGLNEGGGLSSLRAFGLIEAAFGNPFQPSRVKSVHVDVAISYARDVIEVVDATLVEREVDPGATVDVHVLLRRYGRGEETRVFRLKVPEQAAGTEVELKVEPGDKVTLTEPIPGSLRDMVNNIRSEFPANTLVASLRMPAQGLRFRGHVVENLPPSALLALQPASSTWRGLPYATVDHQALDMDTVVRGWATLKFNVRDVPRGR